MLSDLNVFFAQISYYGSRGEASLLSQKPMVVVRWCIHLKCEQLRTKISILQWPLVPPLFTVHNATEDFVTTLDGETRIIQFIPALYPSLLQGKAQCRKMVIQKGFWSLGQRKTWTKSPRHHFIFKLHWVPKQQFEQVNGGGSHVKWSKGEGGETWGP